MLVLLAARFAAADPLVAVVLVDEAAREEGFALQLEDLVLYDALPVAVGEGEQVQLVDPAGVRHALDVAPGEAWEIAGPRGEAWMSRLGDEVRTDLLVVRGDADAVETLAEALGARVVVEGDQTWLVGRDILFEAPWVGSEGLERLDEVGFVRAAPDPSRATPVVPTSVRPVPPRPVLVRQAAVRAPPAPAPAPALAPASAAAPAPGVAPPATLVVPAMKPVADLPPAPSAEPSPPDSPAPVVDPSRSRDAADYVGLYLCGDGTGLILDGSGAFLHPHVSGEWYVSAPGVVRLLVRGAAFGRAAIEPDRHYCRAVW